MATNKTVFFLIGILLIVLGASMLAPYFLQIYYKEGSHSFISASFVTIFIGVLFITPDSLLIRLSNIETWGLLFYRGFIPFIVVLFGLILFYKTNFFKALIAAVLGVVTSAIGFAAFTFCSIELYPAAMVPEVQP